MTMVPRDPITVKQITEAKVGAPGADDPENEDTDSEAVGAAEKPTPSQPGIPSRLPGFKK